MKNILCYGDSNTWGAKPVLKLGSPDRYQYEVRWTTVLQNQLGNDYHIIAEGLNGRTSTFDDPIEGAHKNGKRYLFPCLETHAPLDLVIIMLGTNDLKSRFGLTAWDIAFGAASLINVINNLSKPLYGGTPKTLLVAPPPLGKLDLLADHYVGGVEKSLFLAKNFQKAAQNSSSAFLDCSQIVSSSDEDGIHFNENQLRPLGMAMATKALALLG
jgi:lysophospholipase L1-like esterase